MGKFLEKKVLDDKGDVYTMIEKDPAMELIHMNDKEKAAEEYDDEDEDIVECTNGCGKTVRFG